MVLTEVVSPAQTQRGLEPGLMSDKGSRSRITSGEVPGENDPASPSALDYAKVLQDQKHA